MIGSLMSRMADAEKLSVAQLNQAVKNGTIPAYVGVPLIQEKLRAEQAAKAMVAQTQAQPPIARQVMEEADLMSGLDKLRSNLPEEGFAGGGIVAFAEGGEAQPASPSKPAMSIAPPEGYTFNQTTGQYNPVEQTGLAGLLSRLTGDDSLMSRILRKSRGYAQGGVTLPDDDEEDEKALLSRLMAGLKSSMPESYEAELAKKGQTPASARKLMIDGPKKGDYVMPPLDSQRPAPTRGGHKYEDMVVAEAQRIGLDPSMALHVLYKETGNLKNPESARSKAGALGVMQLMPKTAKSLGVDPLNPEENIRGGVMYLKQMYDKYQDPTLAYAAYNAGPGRVDKALKSGQGIASLPRETQNYIVANRMAGGGIVAFQEGGISPEFGGSAGTIVDETSIVEPFVIDPMTGEKLFSGYRSPIAVKKEARREPFGTAATPPSVPTKKTSTDEDEGPYIGGQASAAAPAAASPYQEPPADTGLADIRNLIKQRMEESGKQKRIDAYMSLLQAGLGMMGGTSPFAAVNIGQGASQGIAAQMAARKSQVADENAILSGQLGLSRAELYDKIRRDTLRQQAEKTAADRGLSQQRIDVTRQAQNIKLGDLRRKASEDWDNSPRKAQIEADLAKQKKNWRQDPRLLGQYEAARGRFINEFVNVGQADNILSSSQL
jgi:hypothetical protein